MRVGVSVARTWRSSTHIDLPAVDQVRTCGDLVSIDVALATVLVDSKVVRSLGFVPLKECS